LLRLLTIAGSDSGGGAGIQADLKTFFALGAHGLSAVTAVTAQNTVGVLRVHDVPSDVVTAQIAAIADDIGVDATKTGMLPSAATVEAVAAQLERLSCPVVVDPVMRSSSGADLASGETAAALAERLLPLATICTPNLDEARQLAGDPGLAAPDAAEAVHRLGPRCVVVTGGEQDATDWFCDDSGVTPIAGQRQRAAADHGTGCTYSAALAVALAGGASALDAARFAQDATAQALRDGLSAIGRGPGPVHQADLASTATGSEPT
jgi:hydroxymethylpyrimidine/phosphomethylpyrimidine kinase